MDEVESFLMKRLNFTIKPDYKPPRKLKNNDYSKHYDTLSADQLEQLEQVYKYDIKLFDYPKTPFD